MKEARYMKILSDTIFKALYRNYPEGKEYNYNKKIKSCILDLLLISKDNKTIVNIEAYSSYRKDIVNKNSFYLSRLKSKFQTINKKYNNLNIVQLSLNNFLCKENIILSKTKYLMKENQYNYYLNDGVKIINLYLLSYKDICYNGLNKKEVMLSMLTAESIEKLERVCKGDEELERIAKIVRDMEDDSILLTDYDKELIATLDDNSIRKEEREEGISIGKEQGISLGIQEKSSEVALNSLKVGLDKDTISKITGLSINEINQISKSL